MQASRTRRLSLARKETVVGNLTGSFTSALADGKSRDRANAVSRIAQRIECFSQSKAQGANHAGGHNRDTSSGVFPVRAV